jgi:hypothetical protein
VIIRTRLIQMTETALVVEGIMFDKNLKRPKSIVWMEFTYVSLATGRTARHPDDLMQFFADVRVDEPYQVDGFNQRVDAVRNQYRKPRTTEPTLPLEASV